MNSQPTTITLYGNVGTEPKLRGFPAREEVRTFYNDLIEGDDTKVVVIPATDLRVFGVITNLPDDHGKRVSTWVDVTDARDLAGKALLRKGDRVKIEGTFKDRAAANGKTYRNFILASLHVERRRPAPEIP